MGNPFTNVENALIDAGKFITEAATRIESELAKGEKVAPEVAAAVVKTVGDLESFIALSATSVGASGLNFAADSAAYSQFIALKDDVVSLSAKLTAAIKAL